MNQKTLQKKQRAAYKYAVTEVKKAIDEQLGELVSYALQEGGTREDLDKNVKQYYSWVNRMTKKMLSTIKSGVK